MERFAAELCITHRTIITPVTAELMDPINIQLCHRKYGSTKIQQTKQKNNNGEQVVRGTTMFAPRPVG